MTRADEDFFDVVCAVALAEGAAACDELLASDPDPIREAAHVLDEPAPEWASDLARAA